MRGRDPIAGQSQPPSQHQERKTRQSSLGHRLVHFLGRLRSAEAGPSIRKVQGRLRDRLPDGSPGSVGGGVMGQGVRSVALLQQPIAGLHQQVHQALVQEFGG
jgi:hypothetical protein